VEILSQQLELQKWPDWKAPLAIVTGSVITAGTAVLAAVKMQIGATNSLLAAIAALLFCNIIAFVFLKTARKEKPGAPPTEGEAPPAGGESEKLARLKPRLLRSLNFLKRHKIWFGRRQRRALYALPLHLLIGPAGSGKTSLLRNSGLNFTSLDPEFPDPKLQGRGGTANCDVWHSDETIVLDTAGRYMHPAAERETRAEWVTLVTAIKRLWRRQKINGVIVAVNLANANMDAFSLLTASNAQIEHYTRYMRQRLDALMQALKLRMPVYVVFTGCDRLHGFVEFFENLDWSGREQVFGATISPEQAREKRPQLIFTEEFSRLCYMLDRRRLHRLGGEANPDRRRKIYGFPLELAALQEKMAHFVATLLEPNLYQLSPMFRGFYFTSAVQVGAPMTPITNAVAQEFGVTVETPNAPNVEPEISSPFFIRDLVANVIIPDRHLAQPLSRFRRLHSLLADIAVVALIGIIAILAVSYFVDGKFLDAINDKARRVAVLDPSHSSDLSRQLRQLEELRQQIVKLEVGSPFYLDWMVYDAEAYKKALRENVKSLYLAQWQRVYLARVVRELQSEKDKRINSFSALAMLEGRNSKNINRLAGEFSRVYELRRREWGINGSHTFIDDQVDYYLQNLGSADAPFFNNAIK